jgi:hypothetical protein
VAVGKTTTLQVTASGGTGALTYTYLGLPAGCSSQNASTLSCTPAVKGTYTLRIYVNDTAGHSTTATATLTVTSPAQGGGTGTSYSSIELWAIIAVVAGALLVGLALFLMRRRGGGASEPSARAPEPSGGEGPKGEPSPANPGPPAPTLPESPRDQ